MKSVKFSLLLFALLNLTFYAYSQQTIKSIIIHDGLTRTFSFYVPANYTKGKSVPLVFNLHGYGSNGDQQEFYGDFRKIADTAGFIIVHPTGTINQQSNQTFWNCGLVGTSAVDDVGFIHALIDTLSSAYTIDPDRIYSTGMSNGGFMSYHLACVSNRFAAIASVAGSMTALTVLKCQNANPLPVMEIHGDADDVVNYNGSTGVLSIPNVLDFWTKKNGFNSQTLIYMLPDINSTDGATATQIIYPGMYEVQHYRIINGGHTWPGTPFVIGTTCQDFKASEVIWQFFARYKRQVVASNDLNIQEISIYPNPAKDQIKIVLNDSNNGLSDLQCLNQFGAVLQIVKIRGQETIIDIRDLPSGIYFLQGKSSGKVYRSRLIKV